MDIEEPWDMGHKPGHEFRKHQQSADIIIPIAIDQSYQNLIEVIFVKIRRIFILVHDFEERNVLWNMIKKR